MALIFTLVEPAQNAVSGVLNASALGANAEISAFNPSSGYLYTVGGGSGAILVSDLRDPAATRIVAKATPTDSSATLQSVAVFGKLLAVAVQNSIKTDPGFVQFYDLTNPALPVHISTVSVGALPDMVKFSSDGKKLLVTNEGEPNSDYSIDPVGSISLIDTTGYLATTVVAPAQPQVQTVDFRAWNNRKAELINRGIRITGKAGVTTTVAQDIEPEAIAITADGNTAFISLQENNAIAVLDISTTTPRISTIFSAGIQDWDRGRAKATNISYTLSYAAGNANLPAGAQAGGLSGLWFDGIETVEGAALDIYYSITDRGPNGPLSSGKRQFLDPDFQPTIYKLSINRATGTVSELGRIGLKRVDGTPLTGLPQLQGRDEIPIDGANNNLAYDPFGIDSETITVLTVTISGVTRKVFAVGDEYRGQIALFDFATGNLIQRYIPAGQKALLAAQHNVNGATLIGAETIDSLPAIYGNRWANRGIEGMAFNSNDGLLYAFLQSPLDVDSNNDGIVAERSPSQLTRILAINPATGVPVKEHLYLLSGRSGQDKIGDVTFDAARNVFLVLERDSTRALNGFKSVYEVDLRGATNTLPITQAVDQAADGWQGRLGVASPERLDNGLTLVDGTYTSSSADRLAAAGIQIVSKVELFNLPSVGGTLSYDKPEGLTLRDDGALVINYDNDFGTEGASGNAFTVVSFSNPALDTEDSGDGGGYKPATNHDVYGLVMPDGLATFSYNGENFILVAGEGDDRNDFLNPDETSRVSALLTAAAGATDAQKAGLLATNAQRLNILTNTGDLDGDGIVDQAYSLGSRSLRIFDSKGNVVFDSGAALEELAQAKGLYPLNSREDDKGVEPEMVEVFTINGSTYAFVALERTTTSMAAIFDVTNPYAPVAVDPLLFPGAQRVEGITFLSTATNAARSVIASSEGNDRVSVVDFPISYTLQLLHFSDAEAGMLAAQTAPRLAALVDRFEDEFVNSITLAGGDNFLPGPFLAAGTDDGVRTVFNTVTGSNVTGTMPIAAVDIALHNLIGVQASTVGNHEFDLGSNVLVAAFGGGSGFAGAQFPYLSANLDVSADNALKARYIDTLATAGLEEASSLKGRLVPSAVIRENGEAIGLVGATTQLLESISSPSGTRVRDNDNVRSDDMELLAAQLQPVIDDLIAQGVNKIILLAHLQVLANEKLLATKLSGVDIILAAGSNSRLGDANDIAVAFPGHAASFAEPYPLVIKDKDGGDTLVVNTDNEFTYLGRLVVDFDANGRISTNSLASNSIINGAYAATDANVAAAWGTSVDQLGSTAYAAGTRGGQVKALSDAVQSVITVKDGNVYGYADVYLEGERTAVRNQETNLGNLTADANAYALQQALGPASALTHVVSLKNGGGIRAQIGTISPPRSDGSVEKLPPEGGISQLDVENSLRFNNQLIAFDTTPQGLKAILEHGVAVLGSQGRFPQIGGVSFSYNPNAAAGTRVGDIALLTESGSINLFNDGTLLNSAPTRLTVVTLNFLANGGDTYPIKANGENFRYVIIRSDGSLGLSGPVDEAANFTDAGTIAAAVGSNSVLAEQTALERYLREFHSSPQLPYSNSDTPAASDTRIQNLTVRSDDLLNPLRLGSTGNDSTLEDGSIGFDGKANMLFTGAGNDTVDVALRSGSENRIFTGSGADAIQAGSRDVITGGSGDDEIWAIEGDGNRLSGGLGDDIIYLGSAANRALGGAGNDKFYVLEAAGSNYLNGGAGADQFWLVSEIGDLPAAKQFVMDFKVGEDKVGLRGVAFSSLSFSQAGSDTLLKVSGIDVGHFTNTSAASLSNQANFEGLS